MAMPVAEWVRQDVRRARRHPLKWLSETYFFRDPVRGTCTDPDHFFAPADGILLYQRDLAPEEPLCEIKGCPYTLREAMRMPDLRGRCLVIGIFMTLYDVHVNRVPYSGLLSYRELPPIQSHNQPMLAVEQALLHGHPFPSDDADYLLLNQRMLNTVRVARLGLSYRMLQIADYDVATILPFHLRQNQPVFQNQRFSQIRFGSQVDLILPCQPAYAYELLQPDGYHVQAGIDPLIRLHRRV